MNENQLTVAVALLAGIAYSQHRKIKKQNKALVGIAKATLGMSEVMYQAAVDKRFVDIAQHYDD